ncbi:MAG: septal ring lytic transglycosylase RlpA family protein [Epsilonproteobacteria bacterium]|nr:septal ring lytic transglycosylase RlpA family protein [Campylobacterota bacterium]
MKKFSFYAFISIFFTACGTLSYTPLPNSYKTITKKYLKGYSDIGIASYYGKKWHGRTTANGEKLNIYALTAAHKTLPFNTKVRVTNLENNKSIIVRINDRGPYIKGRIIDLTDYAAKELGILEKGIAKVKIEVL